MTKPACHAGATRDLPVFLVGIITRGKPGVGVNTAMSRVSLTTLSRWTSVASGVTLDLGASGIDATTSVSLYGRTEPNGL